MTIYVDTCFTCALTAQAGAEHVYALTAQSPTWLHLYIISHNANQHQKTSNILYASLMGAAVLLQHQWTRTNPMRLAEMKATSYT